MRDRPTASPRTTALSLGLLLAISHAGTIDRARAEEISAYPQAEQTSDAELRLATIGYRIATAKANQCSQPAIYTGLLVHEIGAYPLKDRASISTLYHLTDGFGIRAIVPESLADHAGLKSGDEIITLNDRDLRTFGQKRVTAAASFDRTEAFTALLASALLDGKVRLTLRRGQEIIMLPLEGKQGCGGQTTIIHEKASGAWTDGKYVALTPKMISLAHNDDELAFIIAHEMAHNILDQAGPHNPTAMMQKLGITSTRIKNPELRADTLAIGLMASAHYDVSAPERLFGRLKQSRSFDFSLAHPGLQRRIEAIRVAIAKLRDF